MGIIESAFDSLYPVLDKKAKVPPQTFTELLNEQILNKGILKKIPEQLYDKQASEKEAVRKIESFMEVDSESQIRDIIDVKSSDEVVRAIQEIKELNRLLGQMGISEYCQFDPSIVRGLAYYTGIVFEVHDVVGDLRAICGGGRYDNLLADFGGPAISATGMGMGDCVLEILLKEKGLLEKQVPKTQLDYFVASVGFGAPAKEVYRIIAELRSKGKSANFSYKMGGLSRQLKEASALNAKKCIIIGEEELRENKITVKDMATGEQKLVDVDEFLSGLDSA
jgi:histidyl-tRNA synthetase